MSNECKTCGQTLPAFKVGDKVQGPGMRLGVITKYIGEDTGSFYAMINFETGQSLLHTKGYTHRHFTQVHGCVHIKSILDEVTGPVWDRF